MPKRRANGEGNIRKRKDGRWEGRYTAGYDANGKVITKNVLGKTQAEVKDKLRAAIKDSKKLDPVKAGSYTLEQWLKLWYSVYVEPQVRYSTRELQRRDVQRWRFAYCVCDQPPFATRKLSASSDCSRSSAV